MHPINLPTKTFAHNSYPRTAPGRAAALLVLIAFMSAIVLSASFPDSHLKLMQKHSEAIVRFATIVTAKSAEAKRPSVEASDSSLNVARKNHTATLLSDGRVLLVGGENQKGFVNEAELFDPSTRHFGFSGNLNTPRADHTATRLADGRVLIAGGRGDLGVLNTTEIFDPTSGIFSRGPGLNAARAGQSATLLPDGRILFAGGDDSGSVEIYDPFANIFASLAVTMNTARAFHGAALLNDGRILFAGGTAPDGTEVLSGEILNLTTPAFETIGSSLTDEHVRPTLNVLPDGKVQVFGGSDHEVIEIFDPATRQFGAHAHVYPLDEAHPELIQQLLGSATRAALFRLGSVNALTDRIGSTITELPESNQALVTGGVDSNGTILNSASILNSSTATITTDRLDYPPGMPVIVSGAGWQPNEVVTIMFHEDPHVDTENPHTFAVQADANGSFTNQQYAPEETDKGMAYILAATGELSSHTAQTAFTDASPGSLGNYATAGLSGSSAPSVVAPSNVAANVGFSNLSRGAGLTAVAAADAFNSSSWPAGSLTVAGNTDYYEFTITPNASYQFSASQLRVGLQRSGTGPASVELRSSLDSYGSAIGSVISVGTSLATFAVNLSAVAGLQHRSSAVTFRLYGYNATGSGGTLRIQQVTSPAMVGVEVDGVVSPLSTLQLSAATYSDSETNADHTFNIPVTRTGGSGGAVSVNYTVSDGTATVGDNDYSVSPASGTLNWADGDSSARNIAVNIKGDTRYESDETVNVSINSPGGGAILGSPSSSVLTIANDDALPAFSIDDVTQSEGNSGTTAYVFTVTKTGPTSFTSSIDFTTQNGTATLADNDYLANSGTLIFAENEFTKQITVLVNGDVQVENDETFFLNLTGASGATIEDGQGTGTIQNDESCGAYTWAGGGLDTLWTNPLNWSPSRQVPMPCDVLTFDGSVTPLPAVTGIPSETDRALRFINGVNATFNADIVLPGTKTLTISGSSGELLIAGGDSASTLTVAGSTALNLLLTAGATGSISGRMSVQDGAHRLIGTAAGAITFQSGSIFTTANGFTGNAFGDGSSPASGDAGSIVFASGSAYFHNAGSSPFGAQGNTVVTFQTGSEADYLTNDGFDANGRTYANLVIGNSTTRVNAQDPCALLPGACTGNFTFENLTINSTNTDDSSLEYLGSAPSTTVTIKGGIIGKGVGTGGPRTAPDVVLAGGTTGGVVIDAGGPNTFGTDGTNAAAILFNSDATVKAGTALTLQRVVRMSPSADKTLEVDGSLSGGANGFVVGFLKKNFDGSNLAQNFEVGTGGGFYDPVTVSFDSISNPGFVTARVLPAEISDINNPIDNSKNVNASWMLTGGGLAFNSYRATFNYAALQIDSGANPANFIAGKRDGGVWSKPSISGTPTTTSIEAIGMTSMSEFAIGEVVNRAPAAADDNYSTGEDTPLDVPVAGVLGNDSDADSGDTLTAVLVSGPLHSASFTLHGDGSFNYTPEANYYGGDSFTYKARDAANLESSVATVTLTVNSVNDTPVITSVTPASQSRQYSDPISTVTIEATDPDNTSLSISTSNLPNGLSVAGGCTPMGSGSACTWMLTGNLTAAPNTYIVGIKVSDGSSEADSTTTMIVTREDAGAFYTGALFASTACPTCTTATVTLSATIRDITAQTADSAYDSYAGDIRNASVTFVNRDTNTPIATVGVGLVNAADPKVGTAVYNWPLNTGSADSLDFTIGIIVNNYYTRNSSDDNTVIEVAKPLNNFISGGGYLVLTDSAGQKAGDPGTRTNFGFNVKYNSGGKNLQGSINAIIRRTEGGILHLYQVKGNSMTSLSANINVTPSHPNPTTTFNGKASIQDITNPLSPISVDGNATLQVVMTDKGEPGSADTIAITVWNKSGGLWFSSHWTGTTTLERILAGGNLVVH